MNLNDRLSQMCHNIDIDIDFATQKLSQKRGPDTELASVKMKWAEIQRYKISTDISDKVQAILNFVLKFEGCWGRIVVTSNTFSILGVISSPLHAQWSRGVQYFEKIIERQYIGISEIIYEVIIIENLSR